MLVDADVRAAAVGPERLDLGEDALAELVARLREREGGVRVQALEAAGVRALPADTELERGPGIPPGLPGGELLADPPALLVGARSTRK
jgi:hypothetical protein